MSTNEPVSVKSSSRSYTGVRDIYFLFDSRYRTRQYNIDDKLSVNLVDSLLSAGNNSGIIVREVLTDITEIELLAPFIFKRTFTINSFTRSAEFLFDENQIEIEELGKAGFISKAGYRYHFMLGYNLSEVAGITPLISDPPQSGPFRTFVRSGVYRFPAPMRLARNSITLNFYRPSARIQVTGDTDDNSPLSDWYEVTINYAVSPIQLTVTAATIYTSVPSFGPTIVTNDFTAIIFENYVSSDVDGGVEPSRNAWHPHNAWYGTSISKVPGSVVFSIPIAASTMYGLYASATDVNRSGDLTLPDVGTVTAGVTYTAAPVFTVGVTGGHKLVDGVRVVFFGKVPEPLRTSTVVPLVNPRGFVVRVLSATTFTIDVNLSGVIAAEQYPTVTYQLYRRPTVRVYSVGQPTNRVRIPFRFRMEGDAPPNGIVRA